MSLTLEGLARQGEIIGAVFSYLDLVRERGVPRYVVQEVGQLADLFWRFKEAESPRSVIGHAGNMHKYSNPRDWLSGPSLIRGLEAGAVSKLLGALSREAVLVSCFSQEFTTSADRREKWYGTRYEVRALDRSAWKKAPPGALKLPPPNPFIPTNLGLVDQPLADPPDPPHPPDLLYDTDTWRVFAKTDRTYRQPKASAYFSIAVPDALLGSATTPRVSALSRLYDIMLAEALTERTYQSSLAGLSYSFGLTQRGVLLSFSGFSDKLPEYIRSVSRAVVGYLPADDAKLARSKDLLARNLRGLAFQQPYQRAAAYAQECTMLPGYLPTDALGELASITIAELQGFVRGLWKHGYGQALIQGNIAPEMALQSALEVAAAFDLKPLSLEERGMPRFVRLPVTREGIGNVLIRVNEESNANSAVLVQFQNGDRDDIQQQLAMEVLGSMMASPFFTDLRTNQQLGYIVNGGCSGREGVRSLVFSVQSSIADASYLTDKVFDFIDGFSLDTFSDRRIADYVQSLVSRKVERDKRLATEVGRHWSEIVVGRYDWSLSRREAELLKQIGREQLDTALKKIVRRGGSARRVLTTQVFATAAARGGAAAAAQARGGVVVENAKGFALAQPVFPPFQDRSRQAKQEDGGCFQDTACKVDKKCPSHGGERLKTARSADRQCKE
jgi:insulysin